MLRVILSASSEYSPFSGKKEKSYSRLSSYTGV